MTNFEHALVLEHLKQDNHESALMILYDCAKRMFQESDSTSPIKATMSYNGDIEQLTLHILDIDITLSKEQHGNHTQYRATSGNQILTIGDITGLCQILREISRRSRGESREGKDRTNRIRNRASTSKERTNRIRNRASTSTEREDRSRAEVAENKREATLIALQNTFERTEQREQLILFLTNNGFDKGLLLDIRDEETNSYKCLNRLCSYLEQNHILYQDTQSKHFKIDSTQWKALLDKQFPDQYKPQTQPTSKVRRNRRKKEGEE